MSQILKTFEMNTFSVTFQGSSSQVYFILCYVTTFFFKTPLDGYWQLVARAFQGYVCLRK